MTKNASVAAMCAALVVSSAVSASASGLEDAKIAEARPTQEGAAGIAQLIEARDYPKARAAAETLAAAKDPAGMTMLGYLEERGLGGPKNLERAIALYVAAAGDGYADAQFALGELAYNGDGVKKDLARAQGWFELAAQNGQPRAQVRLGQMLMSGEGTVRDPARAVVLLEKGAKAGDPDGQYFYGVAALNGHGRAQSYDDAKLWMRRAAEQGHALAAYNLGLLYNADLAGPPEMGEAMKWMARAAEGGLSQAMVAMGLLAHDAGGDAKPSAADWFEQAARAGDPQGQFLYAVALSEGDGRAKDVRGALLWVDRALIAADEMDPELKANAEALRKKLAGARAPRPPIRQ